MIRYLKYKAKYLFPAYFAVVMTSGALSIGTHLLGMHLISKILLVINVLAYILLWLLTFIRLVHFPLKLIADLTSHEKGLGFFTLVAGTSVFGSQNGWRCLRGLCAICIKICVITATTRDFGQTIIPFAIRTVERVPGGNHSKEFSYL